MNYRIDKDLFEYFEYDTVEGVLTLKWRTGGKVGAVNALRLKVDLVEEVVSKYRAPRMPRMRDPNNESDW